MKAKRISDSEGNDTGHVTFYCPGCNEHHVVATTIPQSNGAIWGFNGSLESPTFTPSVLIRSGHYVDGKTDHCWCTYNKEQIDKGEEPSSFNCQICHSFVTNGNIQFLTDCTHQLAGKTVELPELSH